MPNESNIEPNGAMLFEAGPRTMAELTGIRLALESIAAQMHTTTMTAPAPAGSPPRDTGGARSNQTRAPSGDLPTTFPNYGRGKNTPIAGATPENLSYYADGARRSIADPAKERFRAKEEALLAAIEAEIARQGGGSRSQPASAPNTGAPETEDIPF